MGLFYEDRRPPIILSAKESNSTLKKCIDLVLSRWDFFQKIVGRYLDAGRGNFEFSLEDTLINESKVALINVDYMVYSISRLLSRDYGCSMSDGIIRQEAEKLVTLYEACLDDNPRPIEVLMEAISRQDVIDIEDYDYSDEDDDYDNEDPEFFKPI